MPDNFQRHAEILPFNHRRTMTTHFTASTRHAIGTSDSSAVAGLQNVKLRFLLVLT